MDISQIIKTIQSGVSGIHIQGQDLARIDDEIKEIVLKLGFKVLEWNLGNGWVDFETKRAFNEGVEPLLRNDLNLIKDDDPTGRIYVVKNAYLSLKDDPQALVRIQQELLRINRRFMGKSAIIFVSKEALYFSEISDLIMTFPCSALEQHQVETVFDEMIEEYNITVSANIRKALVSTLSGMEREKIYQIIRSLINEYKTNFSTRSIADALRFKKHVLSQTGKLELVDSLVQIEQIGGLGQLKVWLKSKKRIMDDLMEAKQFGLKAPKGMLLVGMPGCGKSMSAKAAASLFQVPLFRLDIGSLMGKFVGESESNMREALSIAETASPCILWVDELEKAFSGINGSGGSTEITTRLFGYFLTWMQEKPSAVFVIATANDITTIPPELLRRGRFDEIFYIDLPTKQERKEIFTQKIQELPGQRPNLDYDELANRTEGFSGADIECVINDALEEVFYDGDRILNQMVIEKQILLIKPISEVLKEKISEYKERFKKFHLKPASSTEEEDIDSLIRQSCSLDPVKRESAARSELLPVDKLSKLAQDECASVRRAALKNKNCPEKVLKGLLKRYVPRSSIVSPDLFLDMLRENRRFHGSWDDDFEIILNHPNIESSVIVELCKENCLEPEKLVLVLGKLSKSEQLEVCNEKTLKSSKMGTVRTVFCKPFELVQKGTKLLEFDDEFGSVKTIKSSAVGSVVEVFVRPGDSIDNKDLLVKLLVPKYENWGGSAFNAYSFL